MRTLVVTRSVVKFLVSVVPFAAFATTTTQSQVPGAALTTAQAEVMIDPPAPLQAPPKMTSKAFGILTSCQSGYHGGLDDQAIARCIAVHGAKGDAE